MSCNIFKIITFFSCLLTVQTFASTNVCAIPQLYDSLEEIKLNLKSENNSLKDINFIYAPSSVLFNQIQNKEQHCDIFLGNDLRYPIRLIESNVADKEQLFNFIKTKLVLWSPTSIVDASCNILKDNTFKRIAIPNPKNQASGFSAITALKNMNLNFKSLENKIMYGANEYQVLSFILNGNAMLGIIPFNLVKNNKLATKGSYCFLPVSSYEELNYYGISLNSATDKETIKNFIDYLKNEKSQMIFQKNGFN